MKLGTICSLWRDDAAPRGASQLANLRCSATLLYAQVGRRLFNN